MFSGRLPVRTGIYGEAHVLWHSHVGGLPHTEITIAEALKPYGYATGMVGKWHLGNDIRFMWSCDFQIFL